MTETGDSSSLIPSFENDSRDQQQVTQFTRLIEESRGSLYAFIFALVPRSEVADEIFQETALYLWKEFAKFEPGTSFTSWARAVALNRVRDYRHQRRKESVVLFEPKLLEELATQREKMQPELDERWEQFSVCMEKLRPQDQELYKTYYTTAVNAEKLAKAENRSVYAIRKSIQKIRRLLFDCVNRSSDKSVER
ncbi:MAG: sigma-70 family RNA polymerase sigma factor [Planctomycetaceae bacterium]|nr:sigma-70 family RNA polymerase sigma factor [Planctomycetaceae bacterium]